ncbi:MAG: hypothetical protein ACTJLK_00810 [Anaplasma sp.]
MLNSTKPAAEDDSQLCHASFVDGLMACDVVDMIQELIGDERLSATEFDRVCGVVSMHVGKLLAEKGDKIHEQVSYLFITTSAARSRNLFQPVSWTLTFSPNCSICLGLEVMQLPESLC